MERGLAFVETMKIAAKETDMTAIKTAAYAFFRIDGGIIRG